MNRLIYTQFAAAFAYVLQQETAAELSRYGSEITRGVAEAPYQYRILMPYLYHALSGFVGEPFLVWGIWFLLLAFFALALDEFSQPYFSPATVTLWTLIATATVALTIFYQWGVFPFWAGLEIVLFALALLLLQKRNYGALLVLVAIATLNRETASFMVIMAAAVTRNRRLTVLYGAAWAIVYGAIRLYFGPVERTISLAQTLAVNLQVESIFAIFLCALFGGSIVYGAWKGYGTAPQLIRRAAWFIPFYLIAIAVFGIWIEVRLLLTTLPVLAPMAMAGFENTELKPGVSGLARPGRQTNPSE